MGMNTYSLKLPNQSSHVPKAMNSRLVDTTKSNVSALLKSLSSYIAISSLKRAAIATTTTNSNQVAIDNILSALPICSDSIVVMKGGMKNNDRIVMIGTAHISDESAQLVRDVVRSVKPDIVMVELDAKRVAKVGTKLEVFDKSGFILPSESKKYLLDEASNIQRDVKKHQPLDFLLYNIKSWISSLSGAVVGKVLSSFYKSVEKLGFTTGGEFKAGIEEGRKLNSTILLGDRDVDITLKHLAKALSSSDPDAFEKVSLKLAQVEQDAGITMADDVSKESLSVLVEKMKERSVLDNLLSIIESDLPLVYDAMIRERDLYMSNAIIEALSNKDSGGSSIVSITGMAHMPGMIKNLKTSGYVTIQQNCPPQK